MSHGTGESHFLLVLWIGYAISSNLTFFAYSCSSRALSSNCKKGKGGEKKEEKKERGNGRKREGVGRERNGEKERRGRGRGGEGRKHQLIFAIVCDTALPNPGLSGRLAKRGVQRGGDERRGRKERGRER